VRARGRLGTQAYTYARTCAHPHARWRPSPDPRPNGCSFELALSRHTVRTHWPVGERASRGYRARSRDPDIRVSV